MLWTFRLVPYRTSHRRLDVCTRVTPELVAPPTKLTCSVTATIYISLIAPSKEKASPQTVEADLIVVWRTLGMAWLC